MSEDVVLVAGLVVVGVQLVDHHLDQLVDLGGLGAAEERGDVLRLLVQLRHHPFVQLLLEVEVDLGGPELDPVVAVRPRERLLHHFVVLQHQPHLVLHVEALGLELVVAADFSSLSCSLIFSICACSSEMISETFSRCAFTSCCSTSSDGRIAFAIATAITVVIVAASSFSVFAISSFSPCTGDGGAGEEVEVEV